MWRAKNKVTGRVYGPYTDQERASMDARFETRRKYEWTEIEPEEEQTQPKAFEPTAAKKKKKEANGPDQGAE